MVGFRHELAVRNRGSLLFCSRQDDDRGMHSLGSFPKPTFVFNRFKARFFQVQHNQIRMLVASDPQSLARTVGFEDPRPATFQRSAQHLASFRGFLHDQYALGKNTLGQ